MVPDLRMQSSPAAALSQLLVDLFAEAGEMKRFIRSFAATESVAANLPGDSVSAEEMAFAVSTGLEKRGMVTRDFFVTLARVRPFRRAEIDGTATAWGIHIAGQSVLLDPWAKQARILVGACFGLGGVAFGLVVHSISREPHEAASVDLVTSAANKLSQLQAKNAASKPADASLAMPAVVTAGSEPPARPRPLASLQGPAMLLSSGEVDPIDIMVVSSETGEAWRIALSPYRSCEAAARDIFALVRLKDDPELKAALADDRYLLCQEGRCPMGELVGAVIDPELPVFIKRLEKQMASPESTAAAAAAAKLQAAASWDDLRALDGPWASELFKHLYFLKDLAPFAKERAYRFTLSVCKGGAFKLTPTSVTGVRALDTRIRKKLLAVRLPQESLEKVLEPGECRQIKHVFGLRWGDDRFQVE